MDIASKRQLAKVKFRRQFPIDRYIIDSILLNTNLALKLMEDSITVMKAKSKTN